MQIKGEINSILESGEKILWQDTINRKLMYLKTSSFLILIFLASTMAMSREYITVDVEGTPKDISGFIIGSSILAIGIFVFLINFLSDWVKKYVVTDKRILFKSGLIGTDFRSIYFTGIRSLAVNVGLIDKLFSTGTINIDTGKTKTTRTGGKNKDITTTTMVYDKMLHINKPYETYKKIHSILSERKESLYSGRADQQKEEVSRSRF